MALLNFNELARNFDPFYSLPPRGLDDYYRIYGVLDDIQSLPTSLTDNDISVPKSLFAELCLNLSSHLRNQSEVIHATDLLGTGAEEAIELLEEAQEVVQGKYEHDRDERIVLSALVLHLTSPEATIKSKARASNLARAVLGQIQGDDPSPVIDEPIEEEYALRLMSEISPDPKS